MSKKLYYVVEKELTDNGDGTESTTGNKNITVYEIVNNEPKIFTTIDASIEDNSKDLIQEYLDDNGLGEEIFVFKQL